MTDEQWLWLYVNMLVDDDENREHMCKKCADEVASDNRCIRCGTIIDTDTFVNPNFDRGKFDQLSGGEINKNFDTDKFNQLDGGDN